MGHAVRLPLGTVLFALLSVQCDAVTIEKIPCPELIAPAVLHAGEEITIEGHGFGRGACARGSLGCASMGAPKPFKNIDVALQLGSEQWLLATVDADENAEFRADVTIPDSVPPGAGVIRARRARVQVQVGEAAINGPVPTVAASR